MVKAFIREPNKIFADLTLLAENFFEAFEAFDWIVICVNLLLILFARPIMTVIYHEPDGSGKFKLRTNIFRSFNIAIILFFLLTRFPEPQNNVMALRTLKIVLILYLAYVVLHLSQTFILKRFGRTREFEGNQQLNETYRSRLLSILAGIVIFVTALVSVVRTMQFESLLDATGAIGVIGIFLAITQAAWAPDLVSGLILLNSGMIEVGDVVEFEDEDKHLGVIYKTKLFHTEILNIVNNHRIMIKNAKLRDQTIHNLSKFASARGLREQLFFKIAYDQDPGEIRKMFQKAFEISCADEDVALEPDYPIEISVIDTGDHAVDWCVYYYIKNVKALIKTRQFFRENILKVSLEMDIDLATPMTHVVEK
jgi:small-conductance mechanosensitive channel